MISFFQKNYVSPNDAKNVQASIMFIIIISLHKICTITFI